MSDVVKKYSNGEVTVIWQPRKCMHAGICFAGLRKVFDPRRRPWVQLEHATTAEIVAQVAECPSGALSIASEASPDAQTDENEAPPRVEPAPNGPLIINGPVAVQMPSGELKLFQKCALCRCGASENKPFCDGSHKRVGFNG